MSKQLEKVLKEAFKHYGINVYPALIPKLAEFIGKNQPKAKKVGVSTSYILLFENSLNKQRTTLNPFVKIKPIVQGTGQYTSLEKITQAALDFSEQYFNGDLEHGFDRYVEIGLSLIGKNYAINKFQTFEETIFKKQGMFDEIEQDNFEETMRFLKMWQKLVKAKFSKVVKDIDKTSIDLYSNLMWGRQECEKAKATYSDWLNAQIEGLLFTKEVPKLTQLHGENAKLRYKAYTQTEQSKNPIQAAEEQHKKRLENLKNKANVNKNPK